MARRPIFRRRIRTWGISGSPPISVASTQPYSNAGSDVRRRRFSGGVSHRSPHSDNMVSVLFLGSGGARFVVARQLRASGGMWMRFGETQIHVDPGPGALVRALAHVPPCNPRELDAIVLSHKHLDHSSDVNALVEAMTSGGFRRRGALFAPADAFDHEPVVLPYVRRFVERLERLEEDAGPYAIGGVELRTSIAHLHAVLTYG